jgi:DNA-directed RNA polymerase subunit RPC12/RpoP
MQCPKCKREVEGDIPLEDLNFCLYCGEKLTSQNTDRFRYCSTCGQKLPSEAVFCPRCGKKMSVPEVIKEAVSSTGEMKQPAPSREDIAEVVTGEVAEPAVELTPEPRGKPPGEPLWPKIESWFGKMLEPLKDIVSGQWKLKRLYHKWARDGVFAPDEIPSNEELNQITRKTGRQPYQPMRIALIVVGLMALVAFFIVIGIIITQSK